MPTLTPTTSTLRSRSSPRSLAADSPREVAISADDRRVAARSAAASPAVVASPRAGDGYQVSRTGPSGVSVARPMPYAVLTGVGLVLGVCGGGFGGWSPGWVGGCRFRVRGGCCGVRVCLLIAGAPPQTPPI